MNQNNPLHMLPAPIFLRPSNACFAPVSASNLSLPFGSFSAPASSYFEMSFKFMQASAQTKINLTHNGMLILLLLTPQKTYYL